MHSRIPEIYCDLSFTINDQQDAVERYVKDSTISYLQLIPIKNTSSKRLVVARVYYLKTWYLNEALAQLFGQIDNNKRSQILFMSRIFGIKPVVNISFWHFGTYPALSITGENMNLIRLLEADIDIDPYNAEDIST